MSPDHPDKRCCACGRQGHRAHACPTPIKTTPAPVPAVKWMTESPHCAAFARPLEAPKA